MRDSVRKGRRPSGWRRFSADEKAFIAANAGVMTSHAIAKALGRSIGAVHRHIPAEQSAKARALPIRNSSNKSGFVGVWLEDGKYTAIIGINGKLVRLARFDTAEEASAAYWAAKVQKNAA